MKEKYLKLPERKRSELYHKWVNQNQFLNFTDWELMVLRGEIVPLELVG